ncbi:nucleotide-diphospho-sugar transferase [Lizonia empirigonia]|nr:nucleotide-diphospho-sugar transferase [Lizonia empirigonia]
MLFFCLRQAGPTNPVRRLGHFVLRHWKILFLVSILLFLELAFHISSFNVVRPAADLDPPFHVGCQEPSHDAVTRANATLMMLARNSDIDDAVASVRNVQRQFNKQYGYPWVFLNNEPWSQEFITKMRAEGGGVDMLFDTIPASMWGYPEWIDEKRAQKDMDNMQRQRIMYAEVESYHHMCRFQSGFLYDHPALQPYKWYWRVEPDISFTCAIMYDPFVEMTKHGKT